MATAFDSPASSPAAAPFHSSPFLSFDPASPSAADVPASPDPYAFRSDADAHPFGMPESNGNGHYAAADDDDEGLFTGSHDAGPILPPPAQMGNDEGIILREWRRYAPCLLPSLVTTHVWAGAVVGSARSWHLGSVGGVRSADLRGDLDFWFTLPSC
jgi:hypothetical protein